MFDTYVTIVGNALHKPEWRKTVNTGALVTTFKIASTARRRDRDSGQWIDGNSLRVRVTCWRALASNVKESVTRGDPLIVTGRLFTRDWTDEDGNKRIAYELEATAVGHDLNRGQSVFQRHKTNTSTSAVEDDQARQRVGGELTESVPEHEAPSQFNDIPFEVARDQFGSAPVAALRGGGFTADPVADDPEPGGGVETDTFEADQLDRESNQLDREADHLPRESDELDSDTFESHPLDHAPELVAEPAAEDDGDPASELDSEPDRGGRGRRRGLRRSRVPT